MASQRPPRDLAGPVGDGARAVRDGVGPRVGGLDLAGKGGRIVVDFHAFVEPLGYPFMVRALVAGLSVGIAGAVIGSFLFVRRWSLLGDAISHAVLPGVAVAYLLSWPYFLGALATALLTAIGIGFVERNTRIKSDAAMGILFIGAFAAGLAVLSRVRSSVDVFHILFGNVLGVSQADLLLTAGVGAAVVLLVAALFKELQLWAFDPLTAQVSGLPVSFLHYLILVLLSATIVSALRAVGIVLALAMLVTPPATAYLLTRRFSEMIVLAAAIGALSALFGLYLSFYLDLASGPSMVLVATAAFVLALLLGPEQGLVARALQRRRTARQVAEDDLLKALHELADRQRRVELAALESHTGLNRAALQRLLRRLKRAGLVEMASDGGVRLLEPGVRRALGLIRSHRLWERYLTDVAGMPWDVVHAEAHQLEHVTPPGLAAELADELGHPTRDPHGAPIPTATGELPASDDVALDALGVGQRGVVMRVEDEDPSLLRRLKERGLVPGAVVVVQGRTGDELRLRVDDDRAGAERGEAAPTFTLRGNEAARVRVRPA